MDYRTVLSEQCGFVGWEQYFGREAFREAVISGWDVRDIPEFDDPKVKKKAVLLDLGGTWVKATNPMLTRIHGETGRADMDDWIGCEVRLQRARTRYGTPTADVISVRDPSEG